MIVDKACESIGTFIIYYYTRIKYIIDRHNRIILRDILTLRKIFYYKLITNLNEWIKLPFCK